MTKVYEVKAAVTGADITRETVKTKVMTKEWLGAMPCNPSLDEGCNPPFEILIEGLSGVLKAQGLKK